MHFHDLGSLNGSELLGSVACEGGGLSGTSAMCIVLVRTSLGGMESSSEDM